jgi:hypothetical protein
VFARVIILNFYVFYFSENSSSTMIVPQHCSTPEVNNQKTKIFFGGKILCVMVT